MQAGYSGSADSSVVWAGRRIQMSSEANNHDRGPGPLSRRLLLAGAAAAAAISALPASAENDDQNDDDDRGRGDRITLAYVGTYTPNGQGIHLLRVNPATGALSPVKVFPSSVNPSWIAFGPGHRFLYAA